MARSKKNSGTSGDQVVHLHVGKGETAEADEEEVEALDAMEDGQLSRAIEEIRQVEGAKAEIYRVSPPDRQGHCRAYPVSMFSLERVSADYGPGKYRVRFKGPGDKYIKGGGTFDIAEGTGSSAPGAPAASGIQDFIALVKERDAREQADRDKRKGEWLEWVKILAPLALPKILDMIGGGGSKAMGPADIVRMMKDLKDMQGPQSDLKTQFESVVSVLQGARELVGDDSAKQPTGSTWVDLIRDLAGSPAAGALVQALSGSALRPSGSAPLPLPSPIAVPRLPTAAAATPAPVATPASAPSTAAGSSPGTAQPDVNLFAQLQWLRGTLGQLLIQAEKNSSPRLYAEVVLDNLPQGITEAQLFDRLVKEGWLAELAQIDPAVEQHAQWLTRFRDYLVRALRRKARKAAESDGPAVESEINGAAPPPPNASLPGFNEPMQEGEQFE